VLANLKENLDEKARKERNKTLANIFLLNNYYFVLKSLDGSGSVLGSEVGARAIQSYRGWVDEQRELYRSTFDPIMDYLDEDKYKMKDTKTLGSKDKTTLKSRFSGFNKDFEEAYELQNRLFVPDDGLRTELRRELRARILPAYRSFLDRWGDGSFTKNPGKYVKISAEAMESMLNKFFDGALGKAK
jgi:exocyst complex component 7